MATWLVKSEPDEYSIDDLARDRVTAWSGVRNYQARNYLREMKRGDLVLFYHSSSDTVGVAGVAKVEREAYPDPSQFDRKSEYFDEKASKDAPRWFCPDLGFVKRFPSIVEISALRETQALSGMTLLQRGSRLSVQPVTEKQFGVISDLVKKGA